MSLFPLIYIYNSKKRIYSQEQTKQTKHRVHFCLHALIMFAETLYSQEHTKQNSDNLQKRLALVCHRFYSPDIVHF